MTVSQLKVNSKRSSLRDATSSYFSLLHAKLSSNNTMPYTEAYFVAGVLDMASLSFGVAGDEPLSNALANAETKLIDEPDMVLHILADLVLLLNDQPEPGQ